MRTFKLLSNILIDTIVQLLLHKITNRIPEHQRIDNTLAGGRAPRWRCRHLLLGDNGVPLGVPTGFTKSVKGVTQHVVTIWSHWVQLATLSPTSATSVSVMLSPISFIHSQLANRPGYGTALRMEQWVPQPGRGLHLNRKKPKVQFEKPSKESIVKLSPAVSMWMAIFSRPQLDTRHATAHKWSTVMTVRYSKVLYSHWVT